MEDLEYDGVEGTLVHPLIKKDDNSGENGENDDDKSTKKDDFTSIVTARLGNGDGGLPLLSREVCELVSHGALVSTTIECFVCDSVDTQLLEKGRGRRWECICQQRQYRSILPLLCHRETKHGTAANDSTSTLSTDKEVHRSLLRRYRLSSSLTGREIDNASVTAAAGKESDREDDDGASHNTFHSCSSDLLMQNQSSDSNAHSNVINRRYLTGGVCPRYFDNRGSVEDRNEEKWPLRENRRPSWGAILGLYAIAKWRSSTTSSNSINNASSSSSLLHPLGPFANYMTDLRSLPYKRCLQLLLSAAWCQAIAKLLHTIVPLLSVYAPELLHMDQVAVLRPSHMMLTLHNTPSVMFGDAHGGREGYRRAVNKFMTRLQSRLYAFCPAAAGEKRCVLRTKS